MQRNMPFLFGDKAKKEPSFSPEHFYKKFINLSDIEKKAFDGMMSRIKDKRHPELKMDFSENELAKFGGKSVYRLAENDHLFKEFCMHDEFPHVKGWSAQLEEDGHVYYELISLDGGEVVTIYDQHVGSFIETETVTMEEDPNMDVHAFDFWIEEACEHNTFYGFYRKSENLATKIKAANDYSELSDQLDRTLKKMSKVYMTFGHFYAASLYAELGQYFEKQEEPGAALLFYLKAAQKFFGGEYLLEMHDRNVKEKKDLNHLDDDFALINILSPKKGLGILGYTSIDKSRDVLMKKIPDQAAIELKLKARKKIDRKLELREEVIKGLPAPAVRRHF